jgi:putative heme-binding domain-containing protein
MISRGARPEARAQALCVLGNLAALRAELVQKALADPHPGVRRHALRLAEPLVDGHLELASAMPRMVTDADAQVRLQLAYSLGDWRDARAGKTLAALALAHPDDPYLTAAILSGMRADNVSAMLDALVAAPAARPALLHKVFGLAAVLMDGKELPALINKVTGPQDGSYVPWQMAALAGVLDALDRRGQALEKLLKEGHGLRAMLASARQVVRQHNAVEDRRLAAVALLGREPSMADGDLVLLSGLLGPINSAAAQAAAVQTLGRMTDARVPAAVLGGWTSHSPSLKARILELLLSRTTWQRQLLDAVAENKVPAAQIDVARRQRLLSLADPAMRTLAAKVFDGAASSDRRKVVQDYEDVVAMPGDRQRGKAIFAKSCAACHQREGAGHGVGPDLDQVAGKSPLYLLTEILDPNKNVDTRYVEYQAMLKNGRMVTGLIAAETGASITLRRQEAKDEVVLRADIDLFQSTGKSIMPEGLERDLSRQALADLIAYLTLPPKKE